jgi:hypothetical protein
MVMRIGIGRLLGWLGTLSSGRSARKRSSKMTPVVQQVLQPKLLSVEVPGTGLCLVPVPAYADAEEVVPTVKKRDIMYISLTQDTLIDWVRRFVREAHEIKAKRPELTRPIITILGSTSELPRDMLRRVEQQVVPSGAVFYKYRDKSPEDALESLAHEIAGAYVPFRLRDDGPRKNSRVYEGEVDDLDSGRTYRSTDERGTRNTTQQAVAW